MQLMPFCRTLIAALFGSLMLFSPPVSAEGPVPRAKTSILADLNLPVYVWNAVTDRPKAFVLALHGGCLHGRAYNAIASELARRNFSVISLDLRGYGKWHYEQFGTKRDRSFHYKESLQDIKLVASRLRMNYADTPIYFLGESLGANLAMLVSAENPEVVDGVVAVSPYAKGQFFLSPRMVVHLAQVAVNPWSKINLTPYFRNRLGDDKVALAQHFRDPNNRDRQSVIEILKSMKMNRKGRNASKMMDPQIPFLVVAGAQDRLCNPKATLQLYKSLPSYDKELVWMKERGHLLVETDRFSPIAFTTISSWLDERTRARIALGRSGLTFVHQSPRRSQPHGRSSLSISTK